MDNSNKNSFPKGWRVVTSMKTYVSEEILISCWGRGELIITVLLLSLSFFNKIWWVCFDFSRGPNFIHDYPNCIQYNNIYTVFNIIRICGVEWNNNNSIRNKHLSNESNNFFKIQNLSSQRAPTGWNFIKYHVI